MRRRGFLAGGITAGLASALSGPVWAEVGDPRFLASANDRSNASWLVGLNRSGSEVFRLPVPTRAHAGASHPTKAEVVAFARRPGTYASVIDCHQGLEIRRLTSPPGRHFYGHGAYSQDGRFLMTPENDVDTGQGRIAVWDVGKAYKRVDDLPSHGIGPHEILRLPGGGFAIANGGIQTHPDFGRGKLNLPTMRPNLTYLGADLSLQEQVALPDTLHQNSIRHISTDQSGRLAIALQWQGAPMQDVPLVALHDRGGPIRLLTHPDMAQLRQYAGSVTFSHEDRHILVTGPKGGHVLAFEARDGTAGPSHALPLASGTAANRDATVITHAGGLAFWTQDGLSQVKTAPDLIWDNHVIAI